MSEKQKIIKELLTMQKKFIEYEQQHGLAPQEYFTPDESHPLYGFRDSYNQKAMQLVDMAHAEKGSKR